MAEYLDVDPRALHLPPSRASGADPIKLTRQLSKHGLSTAGMPRLVVSRNDSGRLQILDGATRVAKYWVLDVAGRQLHVFRSPAPLPAGLGATAYQTHLTLSPTDTVSPLAAPNAAILVGELLP